MSLNIGSALENRYRIEKTLKIGGMGEVYEATDLRLNNKVAIKIILPSENTSEKLIKEFKKEAKRQALLSHEAIPKITDFFKHDAHYCLVMEFIEGDDLDELIKQNSTPLAVKDVLEWTHQILDALDYIHSLDVVHRDIKPLNLKITPRNKIKLIDFGIAKGTIGDMTIVDTRTFFAASKHYAPIEQVVKLKDIGDDLSEDSDNHKKMVSELKDVKSDSTEDIFALGAVLYHCLTNQLPISAKSRAKAIWFNRPDPIKSISEYNNEIPLEISDLIMQMLSFERTNRPQKAKDIREMLVNAEKSHRQKIEITRRIFIETELSDIKKEKESLINELSKSLYDLKKLKYDKGVSDEEKIQLVKELTKLKLEVLDREKSITDKNTLWQSEVIKRKIAEAKISEVEKETKSLEDKLSKSLFNLDELNNTNGKLRKDSISLREEIRKLNSDSENSKKIDDKKSNLLRLEIVKRKFAEIELSETEKEKNSLKRELSKSLSNFEQLNLKNLADKEIWNEEKGQLQSEINELKSQKKKTL